MKEENKQKLLFLIIGATLSWIFSFSMQNWSINKQTQLEQEVKKQDFVFEFLDFSQERIYNAKIFFWNVRDNARKETTLKSWADYRAKTISWNEKLPTMYAKLDIYFPKVIVDWQGDDATFSKYLYNIQLELIQAHTQLVQIKKNVNVDKKTNQAIMRSVEKRLNNIHSQFDIFRNYLVKKVKN